MNKNLIMIFFMVVISAAIFYAYRQGLFDKEIATVEQRLTDICDPSKEDCSDFEEDLEV